MALALYLVTSLALLTLWSRRVQRVSVAAAVVLVALPLLFTGRALLTNRVYAPVDLSFMADPLKSHAREYGVETPHNILLSDLHCQIIPWKMAVRYSLANGEWPLWNPFLFGGDILAAAAQPAVYDPLEWLGMVLPLPDAFSFGTTMTFFLAGFFAWAFARALGVGDAAAFVAAAGFMFCGMMAFFVGWPLGRAWAWLPLVLFATRRVVREGRAGMLLAALVLLIVAGHPETILHVVFAGVLYGLFEVALVRPRRSHVARAIGTGILALLLTAVFLLPLLEAVPQTLEHFIRDEMYATATYDMLAKPETRLARIQKTFIPGHRDHDPLSARVGPVILVLAAVGLAVRRRDPTAWFFAALAVVCMMATFGSWPVAHALHALPLFDIAINERLAFGAALALSILAAFAVDRISSRPAVAAILVALVLSERVYEDGGIYPALDRKAFYPRVPLIDAIPRDARMTATGLLFTANNPTMYALEDVRGYQAMTLRRLFETYPLWSSYQRAWFNRVDDLSRPFLAFLNVRYAVGRGDAPEGWRVMAEDRGVRLFENTRELPRAFLPKWIRFERAGETIVEAMKSATDFSEVAWIEAPDLDPHIRPNATGRVDVRRSGLAYELDAKMDGDGWVVVSATAWKGWRAYVDGRRVQPSFANHAFLGVPVPRGQHRVTLRYLPESFTRGRNISLATAAGMLAVLAVRRRRIWSR